MVKWSRFFVAGISASIISVVVNWGSWYYFQRLYDVSSGLWRASFMPSWVQGLIIVNILAGFLLTVGYVSFNNALGKKSETTMKGLKYGLIIWLVKDGIAYSMTYALMYVSTSLILTWLAAGLLVNILAGLTIAKIYK
jgi:hypothetical protein